MVELADALDSKSCGSDTVWVRFPPPAPKTKALPDGNAFVFYILFIVSSISAKVELKLP